MRFARWLARRQGCLESAFIRGQLVNETPSRRYLTRKEAAQYLTKEWFRVSESTLARYASDGIGPPARKITGLGATGSLAFYMRSELDGWARSFPIVQNDDTPPRLAPARAKKRREAIGALTRAAG